MDNNFRLFNNHFKNIQFLLSFINYKKISPGFLIFSSIVLIIFFSFPVFSGSRDLTVTPVQKEITVSPGSSGHITLSVNIPKGLHIYGNPKGPGVGKATTVDAEYPENITIRPTEYMQPQKYTPQGFNDFVWIYKNNTELRIPFTIKTTSKTGINKIKLFFQALICSESSCTLKDITINVTIRVVKGAPAADADTASIKPADKSSGGKDLLYDKISSFKPRHIFESGVTNILQAILYGLIAGLLLNFMPCVLPVISLKIMDIVKHANHDKKELIKLGALFTAGILTAFTVLAVLAAFLGYNFGELFQKKLFIICMIAIVFSLGLALFEVYTINIPTFARRASDRVPITERKVSYDISNQYADAFMKGILTTLLATPCSGPFLGGTLAWSFTQTPLVIFIIFICVGIGMASPYILITIKPSLIRFIPKPGNWMITFERIMGFLLIGTAVYLINILERHLIMPTLWFLLFITIASWQYGKFGSIISNRKKRILSRIIMVLIIISGYFFSYHYLYDESGTEARFDQLPFSLHALCDNKNKGKISIVDFTADWCPNCKLVESTSLYTKEVAKLAEEKNIEFLVADLTRENPEAKALLTQLESHSIPFLAVFPADETFFEPICLRDIYSEIDVIRAIKMAEEKKGTEE